ncbi:MAG: SLC13 family permease [Pseudomonadota bacterium]
MEFTTDQLIVLGLLASVLGMLVWGRVRYDLVAFGALILAVVVGAVPGETAFEGFGHPATIIIALVLIVSRGLADSGAVSLIARQITAAGRSISTHIAVMATVGGALSGIMNNVGALALLMPIDVETARKAKRSVAISLMPLSFATILGGLVTLIGTPPNIIISTFRERTLGEPFQMFDFAPVGVVCAAAGIAFIALIGWRLIPQRDDADEAQDHIFQLDDYAAELSITEDSEFAGMAMAEAEAQCQSNEITVLGIIRDGQHLQRSSGWIPLRDGDILWVEGRAEKLEQFVSEQKLDFVGGDHRREHLEGTDLEIAEVVVRPGSPIEGQTSQSLGFVDNFGFWLIGIQREGRKLRSPTERRLPARRCAVPVCGVFALRVECQ